MTFKPLVGPASKLGARLKLHITQLNGLRREIQVISGDWTLNVTLIQQAGKVLAAPDPVTANGITYTITSVRLSGGQVTMRYNVGGPPVDELLKLSRETQMRASAGPDGFYQRFIAPTLVDGQGNKAAFRESSMTFPKQGTASGGVTMVVAAPGPYTLTFGSAPGRPSFQIDIP
jgi:hypothetical protein